MTLTLCGFPLSNYVNSRPCKTLQTRMNTGFAGHAPMVVSPEFNSNGVLD